MTSTNNVATPLHKANKKHLYIQKINSATPWGCFAVLFFMVIPMVSYAQANNITDDLGYESVIMPDLFSTSVVIHDKEAPPKEPNIASVIFLKLSPLTGLEERVDRLIHGIKKDIPPEFDHYGYEIRRYMAKSCNITIFEDEEYLIEQIRNVRKAKVIYKYWKEHLESEIAEIDKILEKRDKDSDLSLRTTLRQNKATVKTFLVSLKLWITSNENVLLQIFKNPEIYNTSYPEIIIPSVKDRLGFYNYFTAKQTRLKEIRSYVPFALMVH